MMQRRRPWRAYCCTLYTRGGEGTQKQIHKTTTLSKQTDYCSEHSQQTECCCDWASVSRTTTASSDDKKLCYNELRGLVLPENEKTVRCAPKKPQLRNQGASGQCSGFQTYMYVYIYIYINLSIHLSISIHVHLCLFNIEQLVRFEQPLKVSFLDHMTHRTRRFAEQ